MVYKEITALIGITLPSGNARDRQYAGVWQYVKRTWETFLTNSSSSVMMFLGLVQVLKCLSKSICFLKTPVLGVPDSNIEPWNE